MRYTFTSTASSRRCWPWLIGDRRPDGGPRIAGDVTYVLTGYYYHSRLSAATPNGSW